MSATQDDKNWFVLLRGKRYGPYTFAALAHAADRGVVDPEAGVWCLGWDQWRIARNVPGLFKPEPEPEPEPEPDDLDEDVDAFEEEADGREARAEREDLVDDGGDQADDRDEDAAAEHEPAKSTESKSTESKSAENKSAQGKAAEIKPLVALGRLSGTDLHAHGPIANAADAKPDEAPSVGLSAGARMAMSEASSEPEPSRNGGGVRLAVFSVLACLVILFGTAWAAISLGIMRVEFMPAQREAKLPEKVPATPAPVMPQTADAAATPPARGSADSVPDIVADMPAVAALKRADPDAYAKFVKRFGATSKGKPGGRRVAYAGAHRTAQEHEASAGEGIHRVAVGNNRGESRLHAGAAAGQSRQLRRPERRKQGCRPGKQSGAGFCAAVPTRDGGARTHHLQPRERGCRARASWRCDPIWKPCSASSRSSRCRPNCWATTS